MDRHEIEKKLAAAEARREEAARRLADNEERLAALEEERVSLLGSAEIARRGISDFEEHLERLNEKLAVLGIDEARADLTAAVEVRDHAVRQAADMLDASLNALQRLDQTRAALADAHARLHALDPGARDVLPPEPDTLDGKWTELAFVVREKLEGELEVDLIDAAAHSATLHAIDQLPEHLRELALKRRHDLMHGTTGTRRR